MESGTGKAVRELNSAGLEPVFGNHRHEIYWNEAAGDFSTVGESVGALEDDGLIPLSEVARQLAAEGPIHDAWEKHKEKKEQKKREHEERKREREERKGEERKGEEHRETHRTGEAAPVDNPLDWARRKRDERRARHERERKEEEGEEAVMRGETTKGLVKGERLDISHHRSKSSSSSSMSESDEVKTDEALGGGNQFPSTSSSSSSESDDEGHVSGRQRRTLISPEEIGRPVAAQEKNSNLQKLTMDHPLYQKLLQSQKIQTQATPGPAVTTATAYLRKYLAAEGAKLSGQTVLYLAPTDVRLNPVKSALEGHEDPNKVTQFAALHLFNDACPSEPIQGRAFSPVASFGQTISISKTKMIKHSTGETPALADPTFYFDEEHKVFVRIVPQNSILRPKQ